MHRNSFVLDTIHIYRVVHKDVPALLLLSFPNKFTQASVLQVNHS